MVFPFGAGLHDFAQPSVPSESLEAARLDGAGDLRIYWMIGLRLMSTGVVTALLFAFPGIGPTTGAVRA